MLSLDDPDVDIGSFGRSRYDLPDTAYEREEMRILVRNAVSSLPADQRMAIIMREYQHLSYEEIAEIMHMSPSAIKSLLSRARSNLRDVLEPYLQHGAPLDI